MTGAARTAIVTGAAGGIGKGIAQRLVGAGYAVVGLDRDASALESVRGDLPEGTFIPFAGDVTSESDWQRAVEKSDAAGLTTVLVNCAGISPKRDGVRVPGLETDLDLWNLVMTVNLTSAFIGIRTAAPSMIAHGTGRIVNIASMAGRTMAALAGTPYAVSKAGMLGLTRSFAGELGPSGITVNAVAPGRIATPMLMAGATSMNADVIDRIPVRRFGEPNDIASIVEFLASDDAGFITGTCIDVNGGQFMA